MTPVEKFKLWLKTSPEVVTELKEEAKRLYDYTDTQVEQKINTAIWWLMKNENLQKAKKKRDWRRFLMNFLQPKSWEASNVSRRRPSTFR